MLVKKGKKYSKSDSSFSLELLLNLAFSKTRYFQFFNFLARSLNFIIIGYKITTSKGNFLKDIKPK